MIGFRMITTKTASKEAAPAKKYFFPGRFSNIGSVIANIIKSKNNANKREQSLIITSFISRSFLTSVWTSLQGPRGAEAEQGGEVA